MGRVGDFALEKLIGRGGMGRVWSGRHVRAGTPVAVKVLKPTGSERPRDALRNEIRAMARLDHPGIAWIHDFGEVTASEAARSKDLEPSSPWIAMELASGGSLTSIPRLMGWRELRPFLLTLLDALAHAHAHDLIHRDLKPANILICTATDQRPGIKLADFGIAQALDEVASSRRRVVGTPQYMAPEQVIGAFRRQGPWTDLYALGVLSWLLTTGKRPFDGISGQELSVAQLTRPPPPYRPIVAVPEGFEAWLRRLLEKHPRDRFRCAADAAWALRHELGERPEEESEPLDIPGLIPAITELSETHDVFWADDDTEVVEPTEEIALAKVKEIVRDRPAVAEIPATWRRAIPDNTRWERGASLFGLRPVPVVGRNEARDSIWDALRDVHRTGSARALCVRGASGMGKSRLVHWMAKRSIELGAAEVIHASYLQGEEPGLSLRWAWLRAFNVVGMELETGGKLIARTLRDLGAADEVLIAATMRALQGNDDLDPGSRYALFTRLLGLFCRRRPYIVVLDDLQWGTDGLGWIESVLSAQERNPLPVLFLCTLQEEGLAEHPAVAERIAALGIPSIALQPLPTPQQGQLVEQLIALEPGLAAEVVERTSGNPMFAVQLVGHWVEEGLLKPSETGLKRAGPELEAPPTVRDVLEGRVRRLLEELPPVAETLLEVASVLGREVAEKDWIETVERLEISADIVERTLAMHQLEQGLLSSHLARETDRGFTFSHALLVELVQQRARDAGRLPIHAAAAAEMLLQRNPGQEDAERLGLMLASAGRASEALHWLLQGVERRRKRLGNTAALALLERCAAAARELSPDDPLVLQMVLERASTLVDLGEVDEAFDSLDSVEWRLQGDRELVAQALITRAKGARDIGNPTLAEAASLQVIELLDDEGPVHLLAQAWWMATLTAVDTGRRELVRERARLTRDVLRRGGDDLLRAEAERLMAYVHYDDREYEAAAARASRALQLYRRIGRISGVARSLLVLGSSVRYIPSRAHETEKLLRESLACFEDWSPSQAAKPRVALALFAAAHKDYGKAYALVAPLVRDPDPRADIEAVTMGTSALVLACAGLDLWSEFDRAVHLAEVRSRSRTRFNREEEEALVEAAALALRSGYDQRGIRVAELVRLRQGDH